MISKISSVLSQWILDIIMMALVALANYFQGVILSRENHTIQEHLEQLKKKF
jgi:hypothetical protein